MDSLTWCIACAEVSDRSHRTENGDNDAGGVIKGQKISIKGIFSLAIANGFWAVSTGEIQADASLFIEMAW